MRFCLKHTLSAGLGFVSFLLFCLFSVSLIAPQQAAAQSESDVENATLRWINRAYIEVTAGSTTLLFYDRDVADNNFNYVVQNHPCYGEIDVVANNVGNAPRTNPSQADLDLDTVAPGTVGGGCSDWGSDVRKTVSGEGNMSIIYGYTDASTIARVDGNDDWVFRQSSEYPEIFLRTSEDGDECQDRIVVHGNGQFTLYELSTDSDGDTVPSEARVDTNQCFDAGNTYRSSGVNPGTRQTLGQLENNPDGGGGGGGGEEEEEDSCEELSGAMGWILCPMVLIVDNGLELVDSQIQRLLVVDRDAYEDDRIRDAWASIRNIAYAILVPITLVMVISTALGFDFISAYTVKRALPRLVIASLFIGISYQVCILLIEVSNEIGRSVMGIMTAPFGEAVDDLSLGDLFAPAEGGGAIFGAIFGLGQVVAFGVGIALFLWIYGSALLLAIAIGFVVLLMRQLFIIALILVAPLAILAWIFPGNDKLWKAWWGMFSKLLMMFPLIMGLIAMGRIFAFIINTGGAGDAGLQGAIINPIAKLTVYILPYVFIPFTFKFAGGAFATLTGMVNDKGQAMGAARRKEKRAQKVGRIGEGRAFKGRNVFSRGMNTALQYGALAPQMGLTGLVRPRQAMGRIQTAAFERNKALLDEAQNDDAFKSIMHNDTLLTAGMAGRSESDVRSFLAGEGQTGQELEQNVAAVMKAQQSLGRNFEAAAVVAKAATGSGYNDVDAQGRHIGHGIMMQDILRASNGDRNMEGALIAASKSAAQGARRYDISGAGFSAHLNALGALRGGASVEDVTSYLQDQSLNESGAGAIAGGRSDSVRAFVPALQRRAANALNEYAAAHQSGDQQRINASTRVLAQRVAETEALVDVAGQAAPSAAEEIADGVHSGQINLSAMPASARDFLAIRPDGTRTPNPTMTIREAMTRLAALPEYDEMRRNYTNQYSQQLAQTQAGTGPGQQPPLIGPQLSDERIKRNIILVGETSQGILLYRFQYIWSDQVYVGVMAQELLETHPEAVYVGPDGYYAVDYSLLGLRMVTIEEWSRAQVKALSE